MEFLSAIEEQLACAVRFLFDQGHIKKKSLIVLGASSSEVCGGEIGKASSVEAGEALARGFFRACRELELIGAVQCCEHLNRSLVIEREAADLRGYEIVSAVPYPKAGGSVPTAYYRLLTDPVLVSSIAADAGIDVGDTLIGMHIRPVAVPVRSLEPKIGHANLVMAYARPRLIGGDRARYVLEQ